MTPVNVLGFSVLIYGILTSLPLNPMRFDAFNSEVNRRGLWAVAVTILPFAWLAYDDLTASTALGALGMTIVALCGSLFSLMVAYLFGIVIGLLIQIVVPIIAMLVGCISRRCKSRANPQ